MDQQGITKNLLEHERVSGVNGVNGVPDDAGQQSATEGEAAAASSAGTSDTNGISEGDAAGTRAEKPAATLATSAPRSRMNDLPDEVEHITQGFIPLSTLLTRLAQLSHNALEDKISELAALPLPPAASNSNLSYTSNKPDDNSAENVRKKALLATFAQEMHGKWLKALFITDWSRKADQVSKLIDFKVHIDKQRILYDNTLDESINLKRDLTYARMPPPDLKTALQILSTGAAPWISDLGYIPPPILTAEEQLRWLNELNTLLSLRLNLQDYDKIPYHFRDFTIASGRCTFRVKGEFEVDLTIADEDFEKQFWFIDFRFLFTPTAASLSEPFRRFLESSVNGVLSKDGLAGCYHFLHEFVLTSKITELKRQAVSLSRTSWSGTIAVEQLNRAIAIQYWTPRAHATGLGNWLVFAVDSHGKSKSKADSEASSFITLQWYRENKLAKSDDIDVDMVNLSTLSILETIINRHVESYLTGIKERLVQLPQLRDGHVGLRLELVKDRIASSRLVMPVMHEKRIELRMEPFTGAFALKPQSRFTMQEEHQLNSTRNAVEDGATCLWKVRCALLEDFLSRRACSLRWSVKRAPLNPENLRSAIRVRDWTRVVWLQLDGWEASWFLVIVLGSAEDSWWLIQTSVPPPNLVTLDADLRGRARAGTRSVVTFSYCLPRKSAFGEARDTFWDKTAINATAIMTFACDQQEFRRCRIRFRHSGEFNDIFPSHQQILRVFLPMFELFPGMVRNISDPPKEVQALGGNLAADNFELFFALAKYTGTQLSPKTAWAQNTVLLGFKTMYRSRQPMTEEAEGIKAASELVTQLLVVIKVRRPQNFKSCEAVLDKDVTYSARAGEFRLILRRRIGQPLLEMLKARIYAVARFVNFFESFQESHSNITATLVTLKEVAFTYGEFDQANPAASKPDTKRWTISLDLSTDDIDVRTGAANPHLRVMDFAKRLVNRNGGIGALMCWLPATLPLFQAADQIESRWANAQAGRRGKVGFFMRSTAWIKIAYTILATKQDEPARRVSLEARITLQHRKSWWRVSRIESSPPKSEDAFTKALTPIWSLKGPGWIGLDNAAAAATFDRGIFNLLLALDDAIHSVVQEEEGGEPADESADQEKGKQKQLVVLK